MSFKGKYRLGLDLGTNSIGWAVLRLDNKDRPDAIIKTGSRIFTEGRNPKDLSTLNAKRRQARLMRRQRDRFVQRQKHLIHLLVQSGLMPEDKQQRKALELLDPYRLRAEGLDESLHPHHFGRALFHLNQRRGFKSSRLQDADDNEGGVVKQSVARLRKEISDSECRTASELLWKKRQKFSLRGSDRAPDGRDYGSSFPTRARRAGTTQKDLYTNFADRALIKEEFDLLWTQQQQQHPELLNDDAKQQIEDAIFSQRPLKPPVVGPCSILPEEKRAAHALPSVQRFRIWQEVLNLTWSKDDGSHESATDNLELAQLLVDELEKKPKLTFAQIAKLFQRWHYLEGEASFPMAWGGRKGLDGNKTSVKVSKFIDDWSSWPENKQDEFAALLIDPLLTDEQVQDLLGQPPWDLSEEQIQASLECRLPDGHGHLSLKAIQKILPHLKLGKNYYEATEAAGFDFQGPKIASRTLLPEYHEVLSRYAVPPSEGAEPRISNPTVHIVLNQLRAVVNDLIRHFGQPHQIHVETARELGQGAEGRREQEKKHRENRERNEGYRQELKKYGVPPTPDAMLRYSLWVELNPDNVNDRRCPFSGKQISLSMLLNGEAEIEHILPYHTTLDNSRNNKTIAIRQANRDKGKRSPYEAFGHSPPGYSYPDIMVRATQLAKGSKLWRFLPNAMEEANRNKDFLERHLNDTRYISRVASQYLEVVCPRERIVQSAGRMTAVIRRVWGLEEILRPTRHHNQPEEEEAEVDKKVKPRKNRDDHRHHAVDAAVVACVDRSLVQKIATESNQRGVNVAVDGLDTRLVPPPWPHFKESLDESIKKIFVSHRQRHRNPAPRASKTIGQLFNDTAYGFFGRRDDGTMPIERKGKVVYCEWDDIGDKENILVTQHKPIEDIGVKAISNICSVTIRSDLEAQAEDLNASEDRGSAAKWKQLVVDYASRNNIRRLRLREAHAKRSLFPIRDETGHIYKCYKTDGNWAMEIYPDSKGIWRDEVIRTVDAESPSFVPQWRRKNPTCRLIMRLQMDDLLILSVNGHDTLFRVQRITRGQVTLSEHLESNPDMRDRDTKDFFRFTYKAPSALQKAQARVAHISPAGFFRIVDPR